MSSFPFSMSVRAQWWPYEPPDGHACTLTGPQQILKAKCRVGLKRRVRRAGVPITAGIATPDLIALAKFVKTKETA